jgi:hypothetical protein
VVERKAVMRLFVLLPKRENMSDRHLPIHVDERKEDRHFTNSKGINPYVPNVYLVKKILKGMNVSHLLTCYNIIVA